MLNWKPALATVLGLALTSAYAGGPGHGGFDHHPPGHDHHDHGGWHHDHGHDHGDHDDGDWFTLGALLGSLAVTSTAAADDDHKEILERSDAIVEQVLNHELPESFYNGFRTEKEFKDLKAFEIDVVLLDTLSNL